MSSIKVCGCTLPYEHCCGRKQHYGPALWGPTWVQTPWKPVDWQSMRRNLDVLPLKVKRPPVDLDGLHPQ